MFASYKNINKPQILDLLHLSRKEKEIRDLCQSTLAELREWKECVPDTIHSRILRYATIKGMILRSQVRDTVNLYRMTRCKRTVCFQSYIAALPKAHCEKRLAS